MAANKVQLRQEVFEADAWRIIDWLEDNEITKYLNENQNVCKSIKETIYRVKMPILTHIFNQNGSFFIITTENKETIGFLRLVPKGIGVEMVVVVGDKEKWGQGLGTSAIFQGLKHAFFEWKTDKVIAKINYKNERSKSVFKKVGFSKDKELAKEMQYSISLKKFLRLAA
jgi:RimJ/RimL family protein N-acetyltransferase